MPPTESRSDATLATVPAWAPGGHFTAGKEEGCNNCRRKGQRGVHAGVTQWQPDGSYGLPLETGGPPCPALRQLFLFLFLEAEKQKEDQSRCGGGTSTVHVFPRKSRRTPKQDRVDVGRGVADPWTPTPTRCHADSPNPHLTHSWFSQLILHLQPPTGSPSLASSKAALSIPSAH